MLSKFILASLIIIQLKTFPNIRRYYDPAPEDELRDEDIDAKGFKDNLMINHLESELKDLID